MIQGKSKSEAEYRALPIDSSSSLKEFSLDRRKYKKRYIDLERVEEEDSKASITGRVVETLLFEPNTFDNKFYMSSTAKAPTGNMEIFVSSLYKCTVENNNTPFEDCLKHAYKESGYKWAFEKVIEKFSGSDAEIYYKELLEVNRKGLTVVTLQDVENAQRIVEQLKTNEFTGPILNLKSNDRYDVRIQFQVEDFEIDGLKLKGMIDFLVIDHKLKTIAPYDLKCTFSVEGFYSEYYLYRRSYIQAYLYKEACYEIKRREDLEYYTVLDLKFLVCDSIGYFDPLIYTLNSDNMQDAYNGFTHGSRYYPGVGEIIADLKFAKDNDIWRISRKNYENKGYVNIKG